jgi:Polyketide cyclase / dehydrase and lipid transport
MANTDVTREGRKTSWRNPVLRFEGSCRAPAEVVYDLLADLQSHLEWAGRRQGETTRLLTLDAPPGPATVGVEFFSTGSDGKVARWSDRSVVTEATRGEVFEFVTDGRREGKPGSRPWLFTATHRYVIEPAADGCRVVYTQDISRLDGAPAVLRAPVLSRLVFWISAKFMRRGFDGLLALAESRVDRSG